MLRIHHLLISLLHFAIIYTLELLCTRCVCTVGILVHGTLLCHSSQVHVQ
jgi:hypothetical protein